ncbi:hypothetical protein Tco_0799219 [Tanacetum coccineum]
MDGGVVGWSIDMESLGKAKLQLLYAFDVCHEKVVEIPLEGSRKLRVQGERTLGAAKALMNAKVNEPKVGDISVVRDFVDVFPEDFSGLLPQRQVACSMSRDWESSLTGLELVLETTDKVYCFEKKGKLAQRYVGPFEILERIGPVAYRLRLPEELSGVHDTFHVSNLKRCLAYASCWYVPMDELRLDKTLSFC